MPARSSASAYQSQAVQTAAGPQLLVMLCDRLAVDIARAELAIDTKDFMAANDHLQHAQKIVRMLRCSLNPDGFKGGHELHSLYVFLENHLVKANLAKDVVLVRECATLFGPIRDAWREAVNANERDNIVANLG
jgi:flagellar protein FliS